VHLPEPRRAGVDEAGRGPLAGPVYAAAVILDRRRRIRGLDDSKKLAEPVRERLAVAIRDRAVAWAIGVATVDEIDRINIFRAALLAMRRAVEALPLLPEEVLVDGLHCPEVACAARAIVAGDAKVAAISAASILAKTARDAEMRALHERFPLYGFDRHKGYATVEHLAALRRHGACEVYRRSFAPVREVLGLPPLPPAWSKPGRKGDDDQGVLFPP
jgi:ribonuclease HII